ncbi:MAG: hypothetical protein ACEQSA_01890 [Weeksellaceae bacterium]
MGYKEQVVGLAFVLGLTGCSGLPPEQKSPLEPFENKNTPVLTTPTSEAVIDPFCSPVVESGTQSIEDSIVFTTDDIPYYNLNTANVATLVSTIQSDMKDGLIYGYIQHQASSTNVSSTPINYSEFQTAPRQVEALAINVGVFCNHNGLPADKTTRNGLVSLNYSDKAFTIIAEPPANVQGVENDILAQLNQGMVEMMVNAHLQSGRYTDQEIQDISYAYGLSYFLIRNVGIETHQDYVRYVQNSVNGDSTVEEGLSIPIISSNAFTRMVQVVNDGDIMTYTPMDQY